MDAQTGRNIIVSIAQEQRPPEQIGRDVEYSQVTRGVRMLLIGVVALVGILFLLSLFVKVEEVARARGEFVPLQRVQVIQTPEGGALEAVLVHNDEAVKAGQSIAKFRASELIRDLARSEVRLAYLQIEIERLDAFANSRAPNFNAFKDKYQSMVQQAASLLQEQTRQLRQSVEQKDQQIAEEKAGIVAAQQEIPAAKSSREANQELLERLREGVRLGVIPQHRLAQAQDQAAQSDRVLTQLTTSLDQRDARIRALIAEREATIAKTTGDARNQRAELNVQLNELQATEAAFQSRSADIEVRAPVDGVIQKISETPIGTVIAPGGTVCEIVPFGGVLIQARVSPRDIGFVRLDQKAIVKSDAFDYGRFGSIEGKVVRIAPSSTVAGPGQAPYFQVEIELDQAYVGTNKEHIVTAGMTGEATILTGEKTIFQYLLKPVYLTLDTAFRER